MAADPRTSPEVEQRFEFETLLVDLSSRFINLPPDGVDREIQDALGRICGLLGLDLAVLWQWSAAAPGTLTPTHYHFAEESLQPPEPLRPDMFPWYIQQMLDGRTVVLVSLEDFPAEAAVDRESCRIIGVQSNLTIPLTVGDEPPVGALGFNTLRARHDWPDAVVNRLQLVAQVFTNALARRRHELALRASDARLEAGVDLAGLAFYEVDFGQGVTYVDARFRQICGFPAETWRGHQPLEFWLEHLHPDDRSRVFDWRRELHEGRLERLSVEYRFLNPALGERWFHHLARVGERDADQHATRTYGVLRDITEQKRAEDDLRELSRRLIGAHEEERALLARELHDDVTQRLAVLAIDLGRAELAAPDGAQAETMRELREGLTRLSEDIHTLAYQLHPSVLEELGLAEALRAECERRNRQGRTDFSVDLHPLPEIVRKDAALCLFRVAQEALNNVVRHSGARAASITLRQMDGGVVLAVRDDGTGFDPAGPGKGRTLGLANMRERLRLVDGTLDIESAPGRGTAIVAWVPVEGESR
jgi:PAS domain S-box-containing protein